GPDPLPSVEPAHRRLARTVAARSMVLLRNQPVEGRPVLPVDGDALGCLAVFGRLGGAVNLGDAGSSDVYALDGVTPLAGLREAVGEARVVDGTGLDAEAAGAAAADADVAVVVVGYTYEDEGEYIGDPGVDLSGLFPKTDDPELVARWQEEIASLPPLTVPDHVTPRPAAVTYTSGGDRSSLRLRPADVDLVRAVAAANPRTVVVLEGGSAILSAEWDSTVPALLHSWYAGGDAGGALADVLFGAAEPGGRLPLSIPADEAHLPEFDAEADAVVYDRWHGWWHLERSGHRPAYPFGFGLGYTTFSIEEAAARRDGPDLVVDGTLANTGPRGGSDVVQVYARFADPEAPRRLAGFARLEVPSGGRRPFEVRVPPVRLARRDPVGHGWTPPTGEVELEVARHVGDPSARRLTVVL
ncbi:MAG: glycoside hydrolase family 3 C-terminal domain-containing protein, partial [Acidimicrobiales bacterium]|nr:glycoside hydrolase family 3 C-terminal domain-containing protein [Acidimicrobiales bacterium]